MVRFLAFDPENPNSIYSCVLAARENARSVRETISSEMWQQINSLYLLITSESRKTEPTDLPTFCHQVRMGCHLIHGILHVTMSHNEAWHFIRLGTPVGARRQDHPHPRREVLHPAALRSATSARLTTTCNGSAVLKSVSGFEMYRKRYGRISPDRIVEFLLLDGEFPRAFRYCIGLADRSLHRITGTPVGSFSCPSEQRMGVLRSELDFAAVDSILAAGLHEFCDAVQTKMNTIDECISGDFFAQRPLTSEARA